MQSILILSENTSESERRQFHSAQSCILLFDFHWGGGKKYCLYDEINGNYIRQD